MVDPITGSVVVFNGLIYNYRELRDEMAAQGQTFQSTGDTAILLRALGLHRAEAVPLQDVKKVGDIMTTNLFTVRPEDLLDLATSMMQWRHMRHVPVETSSGKLVGLLSTRELLQLNSCDLAAREQPIPVSEIMRRDPATIAPDASLQEAFKQILENDTGCLLIVSADFSASRRT